MKTLLLLRHARAVRGGPSLPDRERPLAERGREQAEAVGRWLAERPLAPDRVLTSPAVRSLETARRVVRAGGFGAPLETEEHLYTLGAWGCLEAVRRHTEDAGTLLVVGHNPTLGELASLLSGRSVGFRTATLARLESAGASEAAAGGALAAGAGGAGRPAEVREPDRGRDDGPDRDATGLAPGGCRLVEVWRPGKPA